MCTTDLDLAYLLMQSQFWQLTFKWLSGARAQDKTKQYYCCFLFFLILFSYAIQGEFITWLENSTLNCTWKPISHSSLRDSCDIGFRVQFNAEFPRQVMNFPIEFNKPKISNDNIQECYISWLPELSIATAGVTNTTTFFSTGYSLFTLFKEIFLLATKSENLPAT